MVAVAERAVGLATDGFPDDSVDVTCWREEVVCLPAPVRHDQSSVFGERLARECTDRGDVCRLQVVEKVDEHDKVWVSDFGGNAVFRFDPTSERFERFGFAREAANVRQILGRPGEVWLPESGTEHISVIRSA